MVQTSNRTVRELVLQTDQSAKLEAKSRAGTVASPDVPDVILRDMRNEAKQKAFDLQVSRLMARGMPEQQARRESAMNVMGQESHLKERFGV